MPYGHYSWSIINKVSISYILQTLRYLGWRYTDLSNIDVYFLHTIYLVHYQYQTSTSRLPDILKMRFLFVFLLTVTSKIITHNIRKLPYRCSKWYHICLASPQAKTVNKSFNNVGRNRNKSGKAVNGDSLSDLAGVQSFLNRLVGSKNYGLKFTG